PSLATIPENSALPHRHLSALSQGILFRPAVPSPGLRDGGAKKNASASPRPPSSPSPLPIDRSRCPVLQGLMRPLLVVEREVPPQPLLQLPHRLVAAGVDVLVLHAAPQPLHEHVVQAPPFAIHAHGDPGPDQPARARLRR